jgi:hypothetical protein
VVSERQVARYVRERRRELDELGDAYVPLIAEAGVEAEVDWGEATVVLRGERRKVHVFVMRACFSGAGFVMAFERETQQAFLEGHVAAPEWSARSSICFETFRRQRALHEAFGRDEVLVIWPGRVHDQPFAGPGRVAPANFQDVIPPGIRPPGYRVITRLDPLAMHRRVGANALDRPEVRTV